MPLMLYKRHLYNTNDTIHFIGQTAHFVEINIALFDHNLIFSRPKALQMIRFFSALILMLAMYGAQAQTTYYSKSTGSLNVLSTWGTNTNGTGTSPTSFTVANCTYIIVNNTAPTQTGNWTVSGANSKVLVGDGTQAINFTVPSPRSATATFSVMATSTLTAVSGSTISGSTMNVNGTFNNLSNNNPTFGILGTGSTVIYGRSQGNGNQSIINTTYYNLSISGGGSKSLLNAANTTINGTLTLNTGPVFVLNNNNTFTCTINGSITGAGTITGGNNSNLSIGGSGSGTLNFTTGARALHKFSMNTSGTVILGTALTVSNAFTQTQGILAVGANTLTLNGAITFPSSAASGSILGSSSSSISIGGSGVITNFLYMTQSGTGMYLNNLTLNRTGQTLGIGNTLNIVGAITPTLGTISTNNNLVLAATSSTVVGRIGTIGGSLSGNATVQMYAKSGKTGWTLLGAPGLTGRTFSDWDDNTTITCANCPDGFFYSFTSVYSYDETVGGLYSNPARYIPITNITDAMTNGKGYWVYLGTGTSTTTDIILDASGPVKTGSTSLNLTETNTGGGTQASDHGYNLLANPYPSPISWTALRNANANVANAIYVYNPDLSGYASYVNGVSSPAVGSGGIGNLIPAGQGFYVKANAAAVTLTAQESNKSASTQELLRMNGQQTQSTSNPMVLRLKANGHAMQYETAVYFDANATSNYEQEYDAAYFGPDIGYLGIGTRLNGFDYTINGLPALNQNFSIPIFVTTDTTDTYAITAFDLQNLPGGACIKLHDNYTGADQDLRAGAYSCTISDTEKVSARFVLNITINNNLSVTAGLVNPTCHAAANGMLIAAPSGSGPWNYYWKDANNNIIQTTLNKAGADTLLNRNAGNYSVDVNTVGTCDNGTQTFVLNSTSMPTSAYSNASGTVVLVSDSIGVTLVNASSNANTYWWNFGDGMGATCFDTTHYYNAPGDYVVTLYAINNPCGDTSVYQQTVTVLDGSSVGIAAVAQPNKNMFISRDENGYYVQFNYLQSVNAQISATNILGEKIISDIRQSVSNNKIYVPIGNANNVVIISAVTENGEKTFCKVVNY